MKVIMTILTVISVNGTVVNSSRETSTVPIEKSICESVKAARNGAIEIKLLRYAIETYVGCDPLTQ